MKITPAIAAIGLLGVGSAASAQPVREYRCTAASGETMGLRLGNGQAHYLGNKGWIGNLCEGAKRCAFSGSKFVGESDSFDLSYDSVTGATSFWAIFAEDGFEGTCRPT